MVQLHDNILMFSEEHAVSVLRHLSCDEIRWLAAALLYEEWDLGIITTFSAPLTAATGVYPGSAKRLLGASVVTLKLGAQDRVA